MNPFDTPTNYFQHFNNLEKKTLPSHPINQTHQTINQITNSNRPSQLTNLDSHLSKDFSSHNFLPFWNHFRLFRYLDYFIQFGFHFPRSVLQVCHTITNNMRSRHVLDATIGFFQNRSGELFRQGDWTEYHLAEVNLGFIGSGGGRHPL